MKAQLTVLPDMRRQKKDGTYPIKLRVYYNGKVILFPTIFDITEINYSKLHAKRLGEGLILLRDKIAIIELQANAIALNLNPFDFEKFYELFIRRHPLFSNKIKPPKISSCNSSEDSIQPEWKKKFGIFSETHSGSAYISSIYLVVIKSLLYQARIGTASSYQTSYNSLKAFRGNIPVSDITPRFLKEYEGWLMNEKGNSKTTVGIYTRSIRVIVNEAIEQKLLNRESYPFGRRRYAVPGGRNIKKALSIESISKLYYVDAETESQCKARDFWFFSFYGNGMNIKDIINLKYKNIQGEFLVFERAKTELTNRSGQPVIISCFLTQDMLEIINRWGNKDIDPENYIFPILSIGLSPIQQFKIKENFTRFVNKNMAKVSAKAEIEKKARTMEGRHSASTIMKNAGVPTNHIKESLGHSSLKTTENYLAGFEDPQKKEFSKVLDSFKKKNDDSKDLSSAF